MKIMLYYNCILQFIPEIHSDGYTSQLKDHFVFLVLQRILVECSCFLSKLYFTSLQILAHSLVFMKGIKYSTLEYALLPSLKDFVM